MGPGVNPEASSRSRDATTSSLTPHQVAAALGHHDMAVTLGTYAHLLPGAQAAAMNAVGDLIFGPPAEKNVTRSVT